MKTPKVLSFGSINVDHVYGVPHFVQPGETLGCDEYQKFPGGKGLNQSIALAQAGATVYHLGKIGEGDEWLKQLMSDKEVHTEFVDVVQGPSGHAIIQVSESGENSIIIVGGANRTFSAEDIHYPFHTEGFGVGDYLLIQNETNSVPEMMEHAFAEGLSVVFNPSPMSPKVLEYPLHRVDILVVNETEALAITGETEPEKVYAVITERYPWMKLVMTLGRHGAHYFDEGTHVFQDSFKVEAVDTTGAGDTFLGYFLAEYVKTQDPKTALLKGSKAASIAVTRKGAATSIPHRSEIE